MKLQLSNGRVFHISEYRLRLALERLHAERRISVESNEHWLNIVKQFYR